MHVVPLVDAGDVVQTVAFHLPQDAPDDAVGVRIGHFGIGLQIQLGILVFYLICFFIDVHLFVVDRLDSLHQFIFRRHLWIFRFEVPQICYAANRDVKVSI